MIIFDGLTKKYREVEVSNECYTEMVKNFTG